MTRLSARILRAFSLVVTDRRWAAPLTAAALGFGLFIGVAIGPSAAGTMAGTSQVIEIPSFGGDESEGAGEAADSPPLVASSTGGAGGEAGSTGVLPPPAPLAPAPIAETVEDEPPTAPAASPDPEPAEDEAAAEEEEATELKGVVVHANPAAGSYALAIEGGELVPVHARKLPAPGTKLTVTASRLANGTFFEREKQRSGSTTQTAFRGTVTWTRPDVPVERGPYGPLSTGTSPAYTVSGRGASLLVHVPPDPAGVPATLPAIGAYVMVTVGIEPEATLVQRHLEIEPGEPSAYLDLAGIFGGLVPETGQLLLSADDARESEADLTLTVPPSIDITKLMPGDSYLATATVNADGLLTLSGIVGDDHTKSADDPSSAQGDLKR
jgi:hypothetical protein